MPYLFDFRRELNGVHRGAGHECCRAYYAAFLGVFHVGELVAAVESGVAHFGVRAVCLEGGKAGALVEYAFGYVALVIGHVYRSEACAAHEGVTAYVFHRLGYHNHLERCAGVESAVADSLQCGGEVD